MRTIEKFAVALCAAKSSAKIFRQRFVRHNVSRCARRYCWTISNSLPMSLYVIAIGAEVSDRNSLPTSLYVIAIDAEVPDRLMQAIVRFSALSD